MPNTIHLTYVQDPALREILKQQVLCNNERIAKLKVERERLEGKAQ